MAVSAARQSRCTKRDSLLILLFGVIVFTLLAAPEFINFDARFALFAQEMLRNGPSFFPTTYGTPYPDYPAASTFLIYLASLPFGRVTPFTAVLPTAVAAALVLVVTYRIGAMRFSTEGARGGPVCPVHRRIPRHVPQYRSGPVRHPGDGAVLLSGLFVGLPRATQTPLAAAGGLGFGVCLSRSRRAADPGGRDVRVRSREWPIQADAACGDRGRGLLVLCLGGLLLAARAQGGTPFPETGDRGPDDRPIWRKEARALRTTGTGAWRPAP